MTSDTGTGKYEQLLVRCRELEPVPTAVVHPTHVKTVRPPVTTVS